MPEPGPETRQQVGRPRELVVGRFRVQVARGPDQGLERRSDGAELVIGTAPSADLQLTDPTVSRHHCVLSASERGFLVRDLESTNGTTVNGVDIMAAHLPPTAILGLGDTTVRFDALDEAIHEPLSAADHFGGMLGWSPEMRRIFAVLERVAPSAATVLLEGETGTGKGLLAQAIHAASPRAPGPFVVVDCGAIPAALIESELFGHEKGAFTGAHRQRIGAFEAAGGGTIFLDEIGELPLEMQPKLLRVLEDRVVKRVGGGAPVPLDVRVVAATNRGLHQEVNRGTFRADLFYRINTVRVRVAPLRERREDIALLVAHFHEQFAGGPPPEALVSALCAHDWPGNVRELRNAVERATLLGGALPPPDEAPPEVADRARFDPSISFRAAKDRVVSQWERAYLADLLARHGGNVSAAARAARMDRNYLRELIQRHALEGD